jgi:nucleoid-associated protein YgaU
MSPVRHRSNRKIRRTGQHTAPSQAAKVAQKAGKAAPAIAVAGALTVAPQAHKPAPRAPAATVQVIHLDTRPAARTYTVQAGDTLSGIAQRFYGQPVAWPWLYRVNRAEITDPGLISPGQVLDVPANLPGRSTAHRVPAGAPKIQATTRRGPGRSTAAPA